MALHPAGIHAKEHFGPVLGFGAAGAGIDGDDRIAAVVLPVEHQAQGKLRDARVEVLQTNLDFGQGIVVRLFQGHLQQLAVVLDLLLQVFEAVKLVGDRGALFQKGLGLFGGIPEAGSGNDAFQFLEASFKGRQVKDTP